MEPVLAIVPWTGWVMLALVLFGLVMLSSASAPVSELRHADHLYLTRSRVFYLGVGALLMAGVLAVPLIWWQRLDWLLLVSLVVLLFLTLLFGREVNGSMRWLSLGGLSGQPSEIAKFVLPIYVAGYCSRRGSQGRLGWAGGFYPLVVTGLLISLVFLQPDFGTSALLFTVVLGMLFVGGMRLLQLLALAVGAGVVGWLLIVGSAYRMRRWEAFIDPFSDPLGSGWQLIQSMVAFSRGGLSGTGIGQSAQKNQVLPEAHNDYILAVIAEEIGFLGVLVLLLLFAALIFHAFKVAGEFLRSPGGDFAGYLVLGIALMLSGQVLLNAGAATGLVPPKGIALPLFSAGGSSLLATMVCLGLLLRAQGELAADSEKSW